MDDYGLKKGTPDIRGVGPLAFGPGDILFVADNVRATITAVDVADAGDAATVGPFELDDVDTRLAAFLGCDANDVVIRDLAVHPRTRAVYLSVMRGRGEEAVPVIVRLDPRDASLSAVSLRDVPFDQVGVDNPIGPDDERRDVQFADPGQGQEYEINGKKIYVEQAPARSSTVTDMAYVDGELLVAGMSNEEFSSQMRRIPFPFSGGEVDTSLEIFHVSHGKWETASPIRTFVPADDGEGLVASYTCTPVVYFRADDLADGTKATGRTVAELGAGNQPLDMVSFSQGGEEHLLISNSTHPLIKIKASDIVTQSGLTTPREPVGVPRDTIDLPGISKMANFNGDYLLALQTEEEGNHRLRSLKADSI